MHHPGPNPPDQSPPVEYLHLDIPIPNRMLDLLLEACLRRGMPLDDLIVDAFVHAVTAP